MSFLKKIRYIILITSAVVSTSIYSNHNNDQGYKKNPHEIVDIINQGYENFSVRNILNHKYLVATTSHDTNSCSIFFAIINDEINPSPVLGLHKPICNFKIKNNKIISSYRDAGRWNEGIYNVDADGEWDLTFIDTWLSHDKVKRTFYTKGKALESELRTSNENFKNREKLMGRIVVNKSPLFSTPSSKNKMKAYLVKNDTFSILDVSDNEHFFKLNFMANSGRNLTAWIKSSDFSIINDSKDVQHE